MPPPQSSGSVATPESAEWESLSQGFLFTKVQGYIQSRDWQSAVFLAERLLAMLHAALVDTIDETSRTILVSSIEAVTHLLARATCEMHNSTPAKNHAQHQAIGTAHPHVDANAGGAAYAYHMLKDQHQFTEENQFFFAQCCYDLSKYSQCEQILLSFSSPNTLPLAAHLVSALIPDVVLPGGAQGCLLLGRCCARTGRPNEAAAWFHRALALDSLCFSAWKDLCALGLEEKDCRLGNIMRVNLEEFEASCDPAEVPVDMPTADAQQQPSQSSFIDPLLATPASKLLQPMQVLSLRTPTSRQALFATPLTGFGSPLASPITGAQQPQPHSSAAHRTPPRRDAAARFAAGSPGSTVAGKRRPGAVGGHARSSSLSTPMTASSATTSMTRRKVAGKLHWESGSKASSSSTAAATPSSSFASSAFHPSSSTSGGHASTSEYSSDDGGGLSERERNEKKLVRRMARSAQQSSSDRTPGAAKTPRGPDASGPTTPRRNLAGGNSSSGSSVTSGGGGVLASAKKGANPTPSTTARRGLSSALTTAGAQAPRKRLPEISESTPESLLGLSSSSGHTTPMGSANTGTNLLAALQTPALSSSTAGPPTTSRHLRARSQPALALTGLLSPGGAGDDSTHQAAAAMEDDTFMQDSEAQQSLEDEDLLPLHSESDDETTSSQQQQQQQQARERALQHAKQNVQHAASYLSSLLQTICEALRLQAFYKCKDALALFSSLPQHHYSTPLVQSSLGRIHFDSQEYHACVACFRGLQSDLTASDLSPAAHLTSLTGFDVYSTALWHLGDQAGLSSLALWCQERDSLAAESWIVVGNVFSLQREHELALKFFRRAIQCDSDAPYALTLSAHEYMSAEDFDRAAQGYRLSLSKHERFYNAWYGLGNLYLRQEKYSLAVYHFKKAIAIHPTSSVLHCYLGMTYHACKQHQLALQSFQTADSLESNNPLAKYHLAHVHLALGDDDAALRELQVLKEIIPREANVHFLMGKIWKKKGQLDAAMFHFVTALDLDPKDRTQIKAAIEHLHSSSIDDEDASEI